MSGQEKVLIVDDETNLLNGLRRQLRADFKLLVASSGQEALQIVANEGPIAVAISDMRMPAMDGVQTLEAIEKASPQTVRMMLTGNADQQTAAAAINRGHIFRFFSKPCPAETLLAGIEEALKHYRLVTAEKQLLEQTLAGSVKVLIDVLGLIDPALVRTAEKVREWIDPVAKDLALEQAWSLKLAALLSPIGQLAIPAPVLEKYRNGRKLSDVEREILASAPETTRDLISNIPRLKDVAEIVYLREKNFDGTGFPASGPRGKEIPKSARVLRILSTLAEVSGPEGPSEVDFLTLETAAGRLFDPELLQPIRDCLLPSQREQKGGETVISIGAVNLREGDILLKDLYTPSGQFLLAAGSRVTVAQIRSVRNIAKLVQLEDEILVRRKLNLERGEAIDAELEIKEGVA